jgi:hypothetical protein
MRQVQSVVDALMRAKARSATKFMSPELVVRATRRGGKDVRISLVIGFPDERERLFIRERQQAGEAFPLRKIKLHAMRSIQKKAH